MLKSKGGEVKCMYEYTRLQERGSKEVLCMYMYLYTHTLKRNGRGVEMKMRREFWNSGCVPITC